MHIADWQDALSIHFKRREGNLFINRDPGTMLNIDKCEENVR